MRLRSYLILRDPEGGEGGEGKPAPSDKTVDAVKALLKSHGNDAARAVQAVMGERDKIAAERDELKARLPKEGHRVIDPDTAKLLDEYTALGHKPADITTALADRDALASKVAAREREDFISSVAGLVKYKPGVLGKLAEGLEIEVKDEKDARTGKDVKVPHVKGADGKSTPLTAYAEANWGDYLPALAVDARTTAPALGSPPAPNGAPRPPVVKTGERTAPNFFR